MLDREVVKEFFDEKLQEIGIDIPHDIPKELIVETFCKYVESDYYEWLKENFNSFFQRGNPDWDWIRRSIVHYSKDWISGFPKTEPSEISCSICFIMVEALS